MKLNKKGFALSVTIYSLFTIMLLLVFYILYIITSNKTSAQEIKKDVENKINGNPVKTSAHVVLSSNTIWTDEQKQELYRNLNNEELNTDIYYIDQVSTETITTAEFDAAATSIYDHSQFNESIEARAVKYLGAIGDYAIILNNTFYNSSYKKKSAQLYAIKVFPKSEMGTYYKFTNDKTNLFYPMESSQVVSVDGTSIYNKIHKETWEGDGSASVKIDTTNKMLYLKYYAETSMSGCSTTSCGTIYGDNTVYITYSYDYNDFTFNSIGYHLEYDYRSSGSRTTKQSSNFSSLNSIYNSLDSGVNDRVNEYNNNYPDYSKRRMIVNKLNEISTRYYFYSLTDNFDLNNIWYSNTTNEYGIIADAYHGKSGTAYTETYIIWYNDEFDIISKQLAWDFSLLPSDNTYKYYITYLCEEIEGTTGFNNQFTNQGYSQFLYSNNYTDIFKEKLGVTDNNSCPIDNNSFISELSQKIKDNIYQK